MNIPDTVNDARIRSLVSAYGPVVKIVLRPDHQGAIVEFLDVNDAGKASLELEGREIVPGRPIRVGHVPDMLKQPAEHKIDRIQIGKQREKSSMIRQPADPIRRPQQPGRRGGLGVKRGAINTGGSTATAMTKRDADNGSRKRGELEHEPVNPVPLSSSERAEQRTMKSNEDFRAMLQRQKPGSPASG
jgi:hypothetical protein